jgi:hypothetical protein
MCKFQNKEEAPKLVAACSGATRTRTCRISFSKSSVPEVQMIDWIAEVEEKE